MLKSNQNKKRRTPLTFHRTTKKVAVAGLFIALAAGAALAQSPPAAQTNRSARPEAQPETATTLTLQKAIALALEGNLDLAVATREIEATEGQVLQGQLRPNPELEYSLENQK